MKPASEVARQFDNVRFNILSMNNKGIDSKVENEGLTIQELPKAYRDRCFTLQNDRFPFVRTSHYSGDIDPLK